MDVVEISAWQVALAVLRVVVPMTLAVLIALSLRRTAKNYRLIAEELATWRPAVPNDPRPAPRMDAPAND